MRQKPNSLRLCRTASRELLDLLLQCTFLLATVGLPAIADPVWSDFSQPESHCTIRIPGSANSLEKVFGMWVLQSGGVTYGFGTTPLSEDDGDQSTLALVEKAWLKASEPAEHLSHEAITGKGWKGILWRTPTAETPRRVGIHAVNDQGDTSYSLTVEGPATTEDIDTFLESLVVTPASTWNQFAIPKYHCSISIPGTVQKLTKLEMFGDLWTINYKGATYGVAMLPLSKSDGDESTQAGIEKVWQKDNSKEHVMHQDANGKGWKGIAWQTPLNVTPKRSGIYAVSSKADYSYNLTVEGPASAEDANRFVQSLEITP